MSFKGIDISNCNGSVNLNLAKNRNGPIGNVNLLFFKSYGRFTAPAKATEEIISGFQEG